MIPIVEKRKAPNKRRKVFQVTSQFLFEDFTVLQEVSLKQKSLVLASRRRIKELKDQLLKISHFPEPVVLRPRYSEVGDDESISPTRQSISSHIVNKASLKPPWGRLLVVLL